MLMLILVVIVVMMVMVMMLMFLIIVMVMMAAALTLVIIVVIVMMMLFFFRQKLICQRYRLYHGVMDRLPGQLIPWSSDNARIGILLTDHGDRRIQLLLVNVLGPGQNNGACGLDLIVVELTEVLHIDADLLDVRHCHQRTDLKVAVLRRILDRPAHVRQLAHARRLNQDMIRMELVHNLTQRLGKITHKRAADAAGIHLCDVDAGVLQESAVNADLAEFILNQDNLLSCKHILDQLLDQCCLPCSEKTRNNINFSHFCLLLSSVRLKPSCFMKVPASCCGARALKACLTDPRRFLPF